MLLVPSLLNLHAPAYFLLLIEREAGDALLDTAGEAFLDVAGEFLTDTAGDALLEDVAAPLVFFTGVSSFF